MMRAEAVATAERMPERRSKIGMMRRIAVGFTAERLLWMLLALVVVGVSLVPLFYVFDAAALRETRTGLGTERDMTAILNVYATAEYWGYLLNTVILASVITILAVSLGVIMALLVARTDMPGKSLLELLIIMPLFMSPFAGVMAWIALGSEKSGFVNVFIRWMLRPLLDPGPIVNIWSYAGIVWVMVIFFCPFAYLFTVGNLKNMDSSLEEAARMTGATPFQTLSRVTLPLSLPAIAGSGLLIFVLASEIYTIPGIIGSTFGYTTLPWKIYRDFATFPVHIAHAAAASTLLLWVTCLGIWLQRRVTRQEGRFATVTGKGFRAKPLPLGRWKLPALALIIVYIMAADVLPFGGLVMSSLMRFSAPAITADVFTFKHYIEFFTLQNMATALTNTVVLAVLSAMLCVFVGLMISYMELRRPSMPTRLLAFLGVLPVAVPGVVYGIGLMWTFLRTPLYGTIWVLLLAYIARFLPYSIVVSRAGVLQVHTDLEQSARMCGAGGLQALRAITMPLLKPTLIAIIFFVMLSSIKELSASALLYTPRSQVLSVLTWHYMDAGNYQFAAAIGVVQTAIMIALIFVTRNVFKIQLESTVSKSG